MRCLNCDTPWVCGSRFCGQCGQRTDTARLSIPDIVRELMHAFVTVERSVFAFAMDLLLRPGRLARDYVAGRRRRHFGPFATLAVILGLTAFAVKLSGFQVLAQDGLPDESSRFFYRHLNWLLLLQLPLTGIVCAGVFRSARLLIAEHMVLAAYLLSVRALVLALLLPLSYLTNATVPTAGEVGAYWGIWYVYYGWAAAQFYEGPRLMVAAKGAIAAALSHAATLALVNGGTSIFLAGARVWGRT